MQSSQLLPPFVSAADGDVVHLKVRADSDADALRRLGFTPVAADEYACRVADESEKGRLFAQLRDRGVVFARGREWNPAEVFEWLRDGGHVAGRFQSIAWRSPTEWVVREE